MLFSNRVFPLLLNKGHEVKSWESPSLLHFKGHVLGGFSQKLETSASYLKSAWRGNVKKMLVQVSFSGSANIEDNV